MNLKFGFVFPGQGAQSVGMGRDFFDRYETARKTLAEADAALGFSLSTLCFDGPEDQLRLTYHTQPALLAVSVAAYRVFQEHAKVDAAMVAGHSLGEYTACVAAGAMEFADAVSLVHRRGRYMDEAVPAGQGTMAAVLGLAEPELGKVCQEASEGEDVVELANINCPGQIVISGTAAAVSRASELAKPAGARRVIPLEVSGPFHSSLMKPAASRLNAALSETNVRDARIPVVANVDAKPHTDAQGLKSALQEQLYSPVRWEDDVRTMLEAGVDAFIEFGPGTVLSGLIKKIDRRIMTLHVEDEASLQETLKVVTA
ncbi:ACP S-malonyltransferase [Alicyclobacillus tolerans]|uniref:ACP S-malonyltransferase n=1 Tax=Alicyclobacillus tolerans TaxID=90970 RepID=UPI001F0034ED|nr:ACP S-malonyltransferase [Alicyclobacillus tolerans]MCF8564398.1 ACP S-malonyltransferase [Alicyclobacillus tolerans]